MTKVLSALKRLRSKLLYRISALKRLRSKMGWGVFEIGGICVAASAK